VVFGVPLKDLLKKEGRLQQGIPIAVEALIESLTLDGTPQHSFFNYRLTKCFLKDLLETEGIFRISAMVKEVDALVAAIDRGTCSRCGVTI